MIIRDELPDAPDQAECTRMANAFIEAPGYDGGEACQAILVNIRAGWMLFELPDIAKLTKQGFDRVTNELAIGGGHP